MQLTNKMKRIYQDLLNELCSTDAYRPKLHKPFFDGTDICASDTRWLLRVRPEACGLSLPQTPPKRIDIKYTKPLPVSLPALREAISHAEFEDEVVEIEPAVDCEECHGDGTVEFEYRSQDGKYYYHDCDCPICKGSGYESEAIVKKTGRKSPKYHEPIAIYGVVFDAYRLFVLCDACERLQSSEIIITALHKNEACAFQINDDCEFVLMPMCIYGDAPKFDLRIKNSKQSR